MTSRIAAIALCLTLAASAHGCAPKDEAPAPAEPEVTAPAAPATEPTTPPETATDDLLVSVVLPPLFSTEKTDDEVRIEAAEQGIFDVAINDDRSITYTMTVAERDAYLAETKEIVDRDLDSLIDGQNAPESFRKLQHDDGYRNFTITVDPASWDSIHSFWSMEIYKWALKYQAVSGVPLDDLQVVVDYVDMNTGEVIHTNDSRAEGA